MISGIGRVVLKMFFYGFYQQRHLIICGNKSE